MVMLNLNGTPWKRESVNLMLQEIRRKAIADLRQRDSDRTNGVLCEANGFKVGKFKKAKQLADGTDDPDSDDVGKYIVDPYLQQQRHTGRESRLLTQARWAEYASERRDESKEVAPLIAAAAAAMRDKRIEGAKDIEASLKKVPAANRRGGLEPVKG